MATSKPSARKDTLPPEALAELCHKLGLSPQELTPLEAFENFVFAFQQGDQGRILRISHHSHRTREEVQAELSWVGHLRERGARVAAPLSEIVVSEDGCHLAVVSEEVKGEKLVGAGSTHLWSADLYQEWGRTLGELHRLTAGYSPPPGQTPRMHWFEDRYVQNWESFLDPSDAVMLAPWRVHQERLHQLPKATSNYGLVHADLHAKNFFWLNGTLQVFDTDDCQYHWFAADIASVLLSIALGERAKPDAPGFVSHFLSHFWSGYLQEVSLDQADVLLLPLFLKNREILLYGALCHKWDFQRLSPPQSALVEGLRSRILAHKPVVELSEREWLATLP